MIHDYDKVKKILTLFFEDEEECEQYDDSCFICGGETTDDNTLCDSCYVSLNSALKYMNEEEKLDWMEWLNEEEEE